MKAELDPALSRYFELALLWGLFDEDAYKFKEDARRAGQHPFAHYIEVGEAAGAVPSSTFDPAFYLDKNPDVAAAKISPLLHYLMAGRGEGRKASPFETTDADSKYQHWIEAFDTWSEDRLKELALNVASFPWQPRFSIVLPTYNTPERFLRLAIESVRRQVYPHWELCIADDASTLPEVRRVLEEYDAIDPRIRVSFRETNGHISAASNSALALATGDYVAFLDHDDELTPHALYFVAETIGKYPSAKLVYSDEDKIDETGHRSKPHFKSDWNIDQLYSQNYVCHLLVVRKDVLDAVGGFRAGVEGAQDYDLILRSLAYLTPHEISHIPRILYHWRAIPGSTALNIRGKNYAEVAGIKSLRDHFAERGEDVDVEGLRVSTVYRVKRSVPKPAPHVDIIIPTRDRKEILETCISSILEKTAYPDFNVCIIDNRSTEHAALDYMASISRSDHRIRIVPCDMEFNYSAINNFAVAQSKGPVLALLNNDMEIISPDWLDEMVSHAVRPDVGCVGAKLYYPNDTIQHGGIIVGVGGVAGHSHKNRPRTDVGYFSKMLTVHEVSAVTGACIVIRKEVFEQVGGLDDTNLKVAFNDVDLCLRVREAGYRNIFTPHAEIYHHESVSRGYEDTPEKRERFARETRYMRDRWGDLLNSDPFFNPNLSYSSEDFSLAWPPRLPA